MRLPEELRTWFAAVLKDPLFLQIAPFFVLFFFLLTAPSCAQAVRRITSTPWILAMVLQGLNFGFLWNWGNGQPSLGSSHETKKLKKKHVRSRAEQLEMNGFTKADGRAEVTEGYYPGLVNISGTYCFMNSTLQAMASLSYLQPYLSDIHDEAVRLDVPSPVIDSLLTLLEDLNTPRTSYHSIRPLHIIDALAKHSPGKHNSLFSSREHQDAQELFQLVSECIKKEASAVEREAQRDRGLGGLAQLSDGGNKIGKSVFDGLTANRRSCVECGYTEAVMHFAFNSWQLAVPRYAASCRLEDCLAEYTKLEMLTDCICRKCSMIATHARLLQEADRLEKFVLADHDATVSKKKRAKEARKLESKVKAAIEHGRFEEDVRGVKLEKAFSKASTKQAMIARPPLVLALHLNRSLSYGQFAMKNSIPILFPEILDLTPYTTSGSLSTLPSVPISSPPPNFPRSQTPTQAMYSHPRTIYRLSAVVCHYGQHSFGHYVCFRRKPRPPTCGVYRYTPPRFADPPGCECDRCYRYGNIRDDDDAIDSMYRPGHGWLRISDDSVKECGLESVLQEGSGAFMLYYERVVQSRPGVYPLHSSPRSSEETLKPRQSSPGVNGSTTSLVSALDVNQEKERLVQGARIVRSVATGRGRSASTTLSERALTKEPLPNGTASTSPTIVNGRAAKHSQPLKASASQGSIATMSTKSSEACSFYASSPDLRTRSVSTSSSHSPVSSPSHNRKSSQRLHPSIVDLKA